MKHISSRVRRGVHREGADYYVRLLLVVFATTVAVTRLYLTLTGFPQLGNGTLHIAHLLWGGLLLFGSVILTIIFANRWVYSLAAALGGIGVGLFIDEVGKFITRTNDYFFPAAAPIIYALLLLVVLIYLEIRRPPKHDARSELYGALDTLQEVLDRDLDARERTALSARLEYVIARDEDPDFTRLARDLLNFINSKAVFLVRKKPTWIERIGTTWSNFTETRLGEPRLRAILAGGLLVLGIWSMKDFLQLLPIFSGSSSLAVGLAAFVGANRITGLTSLRWVLGDIALKAGCGLILVIGGSLLIAKQRIRAVHVSYLGLLLSLTVVDLLEFYFDQFGTIVPCLIQFGLLVLLLDYRHRYLYPGGHRPVLTPNV